jgi:hypothetical protein
MVGRKSQFLAHLRSVFVNVPRRNTFPPPTGGGNIRAFDVCAKSGCRLWERGDSIGANRTNGDRWDGTMGGSIQIAAE